MVWGYVVITFIINPKKLRDVHKSAIETSKHAVLDGTMIAVSAENGGVILVNTLHTELDTVQQFATINFLQFDNTNFEQIL